jgi:Ulp1 family protease
MSYTGNRLLRSESNDSVITYLDSQESKTWIRDCSTLISSTADTENKAYVARKLRKRLNKGGTDLLRRKLIFIPSNISNNHWVLFGLFNPGLCVSLSNALSVP